MNMISSFKVLVSLFMIIASVNGATITPRPSNFSESFDITWGSAPITNGGQLLTLTLDKGSGSGFVSKSRFLYGRFDMQIKLVPGNSAGTVTTYYLSSEGPSHDEVDLEFLGNSSGDPYTLHTNVFSQGKGNREQQFRLWFDPTTGFHTYSILWNKKNIVFYVDNIPIRVFNNRASSNVPYPSKQPMRVFSSLWNADDWATQGGRVKSDWSKAPFLANYKNFKINACTSVSGKSSCEQAAANASAAASWLDAGVDEANAKKLRWVQQKYMIYNYCADLKRFPQGLPIECRKIN